MARRVVPTPISHSFVVRILEQTAAALKRGDIHNGHVMIKFGADGNNTGSAALFYTNTWRGKRAANHNDPDFFVGEWKPMSDSPNE